LNFTKPIIKVTLVASKYEYSQVTDYFVADTLCTNPKEPAAKKKKVTKLKDRTLEQWVAMPKQVLILEAQQLHIHSAGSARRLAYDIYDTYHPPVEDGQLPSGSTLTPSISSPAPLPLSANFICKF